jgi:hypothetical protein
MLLGWGDSGYTFERAYVSASLARPEPRLRNGLRHYSNASTAVQRQPEALASSGP